MASSIYLTFIFVEMLYNLGCVFFYIFQFQHPIRIVNVFYLDIDTIAIVSYFSNRRPLPPLRQFKGIMRLITSKNLGETFYLHQDFELLSSVICLI